MSAAEPFECMPIAEDLTPWEASVVTLEDDAVMLTYSLREVRYLQGIISRDRCRTWEEPFFLRSVSGERIAGWRSSPLRLASGNLGIFYSTLPQQPGRDGPLGFRVSADEGRTWSEQTQVDSHFAVLRNGCARVLKDGRILCPAYRWITHHLEDAEQDGTQLSYSFAYFSDDEGGTWQRSANELMIRHNDVEYDLVDGKGFRLVEEEPAGLYEYLQFEKYGEPVAEELREGRLINLARCRLGTLFMSYSADGGVSWSKPQPSGLAAADAPPTTARLPGSGDLLVIWNQASPDEIACGLARHRLSCAVSSDEGRTWKHFRNLESLDDECHLPVPPLQVYQQPIDGYKQPIDRNRYHRAPGAVRCAYSAITFVGSDAVVCYDYGWRPDPVTGRRKHFGTKVKVVPCEWFTEG